MHFYNENLEKLIFKEYNAQKVFYYFKTTITDSLSFNQTKINI